MTFAQLLQEIEKIEGLERIRFMTSHPKDLSDELIEVMKNSKKICRHLHLPLQSGSSEILKKMNRKYDKEQYLNLVERIRKAMPDISLTTDIIVGFPGETEEDFLETVDVVEKVRYDSAFTFIYSKRTGTPAAAMENQIPEDVVKDRFDRLLARVQEIGRSMSARYTGTVQEVLVEEQNSQDTHLMTGRLSNNLVVHFEGDTSLIGKLCQVRLDAVSYTHLDVYKRQYVCYGHRTQRRCSVCSYAGAGHRCGKVFSPVLKEFRRRKYALRESTEFTEGKRLSFYLHRRRGVWKS